jgi:ABC-type multidrug transport system fused ATPase/permease subunit
MWDKPYGRKLKAKAMTKTSILSYLKQLFTLKFYRDGFSYIYRKVSSFVQYVEVLTSLNSRSRLFRGSIQLSTVDVDNPLHSYSYNDMSTSLPRDDVNTELDNLHHSIYGSNTGLDMKKIDAELLTEEEYRIVVQKILLLESERLIEQLETQVTELSTQLQKVDHTPSSMSKGNGKLAARKSSKTKSSENLEEMQTVVTKMIDMEKSDFPVSNKYSSENSSDRWLTLFRINMKVKRGEIVAIVGQVGSGKSSIISTLLGDMNIVRGSVHKKGKVAYVGQRPFIQNR